MFVTFEGLDGSGKSTQAELLRARLEADGVDVVATREPGGTELGEGIRDLVLHGGHVGPWAEALLYVAARAELVDAVIRPALERGAAVICDRYIDSSVAYQGVGRELGLQRMLDINLASVGGLLPDSHLPARARPERRSLAHPAALRPARTRRRRLPRACRRGLPRTCRAFPGAHRRPRRDAPGRRARRGGVWSPSRPYLSSPRRSAS